MADEASLSKSRKRDTLLMQSHKFNADETNSKKALKFRWSTCVEFINKLKQNKPKRTKFVSNNEIVQSEIVQSESSIGSFIQGSDGSNVVKPYSAVNDKQFYTTNAIEDIETLSQRRPLLSLSPPPRQTKSKRESTSAPNGNAQSTVSNYNDRSPLNDLILTPKVKPSTSIRSISTHHNSLLRLSLDVDMLQQNDSPVSAISGFASPFRSGTLGLNRRSSYNSWEATPTLPITNNANIPLACLDKSSAISLSPRSRTSLSQIILTVDSSDSIYTFDSSDEEKLTLRERRHRRSPLSVQGTEQLTLALKEMTILEQESTLDKEPKDLSLEQITPLSLQVKSRQEAMLSLEGKNTKKQHKATNVPSGSQQRSGQQLDQKSLGELTKVPETPPHHIQNTPSLISVPSTPNSFDSSLLDHEECLQENGGGNKHHHHLSMIPSVSDLE